MVPAINVTDIRILSSRRGCYSYFINIQTITTGEPENGLVLRYVHGEVEMISKVRVHSR